MSLLVGLTLVRLFIIYHDYQHGAIFRESRLGHALMYWVGFLTLAVPSIWREDPRLPPTATTPAYWARPLVPIPLVSLGIWQRMPTG